MIPVVASEVHPIPVPAGGGLPLFQQVPEGEEAPARVVEYRVQDHPDAQTVAEGHERAQVPVVSQAAVQPAVVLGLVAVARGFKEGAHVQGGAAQLRQMPDPALQLPQPVDRSRVGVLPGGSRETQGIDMIKNSLFKPTQNIVPSFPLAPLIIAQAGPGRKRQK